VATASDQLTQPTVSTASHIVLLPSCWHWSTVSDYTYCNNFPCYLHYRWKIHKAQFSIC